MVLTSERENRWSREARLLISQPENVFEELRRRAHSTETADVQLERRLLDRDDPIIDLGLACFGRDEGVVETLYAQTMDASAQLSPLYRKGLRLACLSNSAVFNRDFPEHVIGKEETRRLLIEGDDDELEALLCNPLIGKKIARIAF